MQLWLSHGTFHLRSNISAVLVAAKTSSTWVGTGVVGLPLY